MRKSITGYDKYEVSDTGRVRKKLGGNGYKMMCRIDCGNGYLRVGLNLQGKQKFIFIHRLVAQEFIGDIVGKLVCHKNDIPADNRVDNLFIGTYADNSKDMVKKGRQNTPKGERKIKSHKLSKIDVSIIKNMKGTKSTREIARLYNISQSVVSNIQNNKARI